MCSNSFKIHHSKVRQGAFPHGTYPWLPLDIIHHNLIGQINAWDKKQTQVFSFGVASGAFPSTFLLAVLDLACLGESIYKAHFLQAGGMFSVT
jgi:hypothetical protein